MKIKLLTIYHKKDLLFKNEIVQPIQVGRNRFDTVNEDPELAAWFDLNMIKDNTGDNISSKNSYYNEMTAIYWAWKNYSEIGNPDYIGFQHYRRHFIFEERRSAYYECNKCTESYFVDELKLTDDNIDRILSKGDFIAAKPYYFDSVYSHYKNTLDIAELDSAIEILKRLKPEYAQSCDEYMNGKASFFFNMFIMPKEMFFKYCEFIFPILEEYESTHDMTGKRMYISERLTGTFIYHMMKNKKRCIYLPTMYLEETTVIPIVMATDENYLIPTSTAVLSIMKNSKKSTLCEFHILISGEIADKVDKYLSPIFKKYENGCYTTHVVRMERDYALKISHITQSTFYRLYLTRILPDCKKCLYVDGDMIILTDLATIFRTNISEKYVAGVRAAGYYYPQNWVEKHSKEIGVPIDQYVNAGFLLLNLDKIRKDGIDELMLEYAKNNYTSQDQDVINKACYGNIRILDYEWNLMIKYLSKVDGKVIMDKNAAGVYQCKPEIEKLPKIIHYADKVKPWNGDCIYSEIWNEYHSEYKHLSMDTKVAVIVPVYNKEEYLVECLDSILNQTLKEIEVICVNDGSTDSSIQILREYAKKDSRILVFDQQNAGVAVARNKGIKNSNSEFIIFMDPDDYYPDNGILEKLYSAAKRNNVLVSGGSWSELIDGKVKTDFIGKYQKYTFSKEEVIKFSDYQFDYGFQRFLFSSDLILSHNIMFPPYSRFQDPPFFLKTMNAASKFCAIPDVVYRYRLGQQNIVWNDKRCKDLMLGIIDNLRISSRTKQANVHRLNVDRINHEYAERIVNRIKTPDSDPYLLELLIRANTAIDRPLLKTIIPSINDNFCIGPLMTLIKYFASLKVDGSVSDKNEGYKAGSVSDELDSLRLKSQLNPADVGKYADALLKSNDKANINKAMALLTENASFYPEYYVKLGDIYNNGKYVDKNEVKALQLYRIANSEGHKGSLEKIMKILWVQGTTSSIEELKSICKEQSDYGDPTAFLYLARMYRYGKGYRKNFKKSVEMYGKSGNKMELAEYLYKEGKYSEAIELLDLMADEGNGKAMSMLGRAYRDGCGVPEDLFIAAECMREASKNGASWAESEILPILWKKGDADSIKEMIAIAQKLEAKGDYRAIGSLGRAYRYGMGVDQDTIKARKYLKLAAENGVSWAKTEYNSLQDEMLAFNNECESIKEQWKSKKYDGLFDATKKLADSGNPVAMGYLGRMYRDGKGIKQNLSESESWLLRSAKYDIVWAQNELVDLLWKENRFEEAMILAGKYLDYGNLGAAARLGRGYRTGKGVVQDLQKAENYYRIAADFGVKWSNEELLEILWKEKKYDELAIRAQSLSDNGSSRGDGYLGLAYRDGRGLEADPVKAKFYLDRASSRSSSWAKEMERLHTQSV